MFTIIYLWACSWGPTESEAPSAPPVLQTGQASFYGKGFAGRPTASGEPFDPAAKTAAHRTLPFGTKLEVTDVARGTSVTVEVTDRGPYADDRILDLSRGAAEVLGFVDDGTTEVELRVVECPEGESCGAGAEQ